jgi:hypothetical protein
MYQIRYLDPITGAVVEAQSRTLEEAVASIKKAKDNLYFKGYAQASESEGGESLSKDDQKSVQHEEVQAELEVEYETETPSIEDEDYWYPYGVTLW